MLLDEKDLLVLENSECRAYFKEILQCYYSQNYRGTIVLLYSFVIYDLYMKLQTMAKEGNPAAETKLTEVKAMIADDEKYSKVEKTVVQFFKEHCSLYFNKFSEDIDYLTNCRNKCAHLKVDDNSLYVPNDYQVRMLICSMFDNILSVKAPFITDLFNIAQSEVERYSNTIFYIEGFTDAIKNEITTNYLKRMTDDSLKKSYKTFLKLLFLTDDEDCKRNKYGLYAFSYSLTDYLISNSKFIIFNEIVEVIIPKIKIDKLEEDEATQEILFQFVKKFPKLLDTIQNYDELYKYTTNTIFLNPRDFKKYYNPFYARTEKTIFSYFKENKSLHITTSTTGFYDAVCESPDFSLIEFLELMMKSVPDYSGFHDADCYMNCLLNHLNDLTLENLDNLRTIYKSNNQLYGRGRNDIDTKKINDYISNLKSQTADTSTAGIAW